MHAKNASNMQANIENDKICLVRGASLTNFCAPAAAAAAKRLEAPYCWVLRGKWGGWFFQKKNERGGNRKPIFSEIDMMSDGNFFARGFSILFQFFIFDVPFSRWGREVQRQPRVFGQDLMPCPCLNFFFSRFFLPCAGCRECVLHWAVLKTWMFFEVFALCRWFRLGRNAVLRFYVRYDCAGSYKVCGPQSAISKASFYRVSIYACGHELQNPSYAEMSLRMLSRDQCSISYDLGSLFRM